MQPKRLATVSLASRPSSLAKTIWYPANAPVMRSRTPTPMSSSPADARRVGCRSRMSDRIESTRSGTPIGAPNSVTVRARPNSADTMSASPARTIISLEGIEVQRLSGNQARPPNRAVSLEPILRVRAARPPLVCATRPISSATVKQDRSISDGLGPNRLFVGADRCAQIHQTERYATAGPARSEREPPTQRCQSARGPAALEPLGAVVSGFGRFSSQPISLTRQDRLLASR